MTISDASAPASINETPALSEGTVDATPVAPVAAGQSAGKQPMAPETVTIRHFYATAPSADDDGAWDKGALDEWLSKSDSQMVRASPTSGNHS